MTTNRCVLLSSKMVFSSSGAQPAIEPGHMCTALTLKEKFERSIWHEKLVCHWSSCASNLSAFPESFTGSWGGLSLSEGANIFCDCQRFRINSLRSSWNNEHRKWLTNQHKFLARLPSNKKFIFQLLANGCNYLNAKCVLFLFVNQSSLDKAETSGTIREYFCSRVLQWEINS